MTHTPATLPGGEDARREKDKGQSGLIDGATIVRYEHGGGRIWFESEKGGRDLVVDIYADDEHAGGDPAARREKIIAALEAPLNRSPLVEEMATALEAQRPIIEGLIAAQYNVETWGLKGRLAILDTVLRNFAVARARGSAP